jgi:hypothetical protein
MDAKIEEVSSDGLSKQEWDFYFDVGPGSATFNLYLDNYSIWSRESKRHGWKLEGRYSRLERRHSNINLADVPFDEDIKITAKKAVVDKIVVKLWDRS